MRSSRHDPPPAGSQSQAGPSPGSGLLSICATPIGNLQDITLRCLETLKQADLILAEDTRQTRKLLSHFDIHTPLQSFHAHNEQGRVTEVIDRLARGESLALVSDAGLPLISDPGAGLVRAVQDAGFKVTCLPGPSAPATGLLLSGIAPLPYCFLGFLPRQSKARRELLQSWRRRSETLVFFESPHRLAESLADLAEQLGGREAAVCRELTKLYEEIRRAPLPALAAYYRQHQPRGEITLVVAGAGPEDSEAETEAPAADPAALRAAYDALQASGLNRKAIFVKLQQDFGLARNELYRRLEEA